ncbi:MAG: hypothetical protein RLZZ20_920 [Pseudomonadota bacterium]
MRVNFTRSPAQLAALLLCATPVASAQEAAKASATTMMALGEVVVTANRDPLSVSSLYTSVNVLPAERIEQQAVANNWQLFDQVPGVMLTTFGQGTTSGKLSMRGFNGEGEINAVKLLIDGIPSNSNDGNMPYIDLAPRLDIDAIEVVKGTNDPRYGLHNIAGNANIVTKAGSNYQLGRISYGSFNTRDVQAATGIDDGRLSQNYAFSYMNTDGYRRHSQAENATFSGKWFLHSEDRRHQVGLIARHAELSAQEAGYLTRAQAEADPRQSRAHNASDEGGRRMTQLALQGKSAIRDDLTASAQIYLNDLHDKRYVRFSAGTSQQERLVDETHLGASASASWQAGKTSFGELTLTGGVDAEHQDNRSERYSTLMQSRTAQTRNQQFDFNTMGSFVQAMLKPSDRLTITPALRIDSISGEYTNRLNGVLYDLNDYGLIRQPKLSAMYQWSESVSVYGNVGRSFQVGVGTAAYRVNQAINLAPSINEGWEAGVRFRPAMWLDGRIALWQQTASNEARRKLNDPANDAENIGKTRRQGIDVELNARPSPRLNFWVAGAVQRSEILKADASSLATEGKEIDHVPRAIYNLGADYHHSEQLRYSVWANGQSSYYLERTNSTGRFGSYLLTHASATYRVNKAVSAELQVRNLFDRYQEYVWYDGTQSLHSPGAGRAVYVSLQVRM